MIYAYEDKYDPNLKGILKVGYTTIGVQERVRQQYNIVRPGEPPYRILVEESAMRQDGTLGRTRRATREENGSRVVLVDGGHRSGMVGTVGDGDGLAGHTGDAFGKVLAVSDDFHAKLHAAAHHGLGRQLRWQVDGHEARRSGGEKHFDGINGGVVQDGHLVAFLQAKVVEQGAFACHYVAYLLVA